MCSPPSPGLRTIDVAVSADGVQVTCWDGTEALGAGRAVALNP
jgi:hypothetical protein